MSDRAGCHAQRSTLCCTPPGQPLDEATRATRELSPDRPSARTRAHGAGSTRGTALPSGAWTVISEGGISVCSAARCSRCAWWHHAADSPLRPLSGEVRFLRADRHPRVLRLRLRRHRCTPAGGQRVGHRGEASGAAGGPGVRRSERRLLPLCHRSRLAVRGPAALGALRRSVHRGRERVRDGPGAARWRRAGDVRGDGRQHGRPGLRPAARRSARAVCPLAPVPAVRRVPRPGRRLGRCPAGAPGDGTGARSR